jgi:hypothetical protein
MCGTFADGRVLMTQRVVVSYTDDLDGSPAEETVTFRLDGHDYQIDLSGAHARQLRELFAPYVSAGRRGKNTRRVTGGGATVGHSSAEARREARQMRRWLAGHGYTVKDRGPIPDALAQAYRSDTPASENTAIAPVFRSAP